MTVVDWVRGKIRERQNRRRRDRPARMTPYGFQFSGPEVMQNGTFEKEEVALFTALIKDADRFVNIGANYGLYVCLAARHGVRSVAIEPIPDNRTLLQRNIDVNGYGDLVEVHACACGSVAGQLDIFGTGTGASMIKGWARNPESLRTTVPVQRLDAIVPGSGVSEKTVVLCDVEGFELDVLKGADGVLGAREKPTWILECSLTDHRPGSDLNAEFLTVFDLVQAFGYQVALIETPDTPIERERIVESLETKRDLVNAHNLLLRPR
jgi:FkbM family methyltransferase